jgi:hypothetical protein
LLRERYEFFETRVTGHKEVWNGLKQAIDCLREGDLADAQGILTAMSVTLPTGKLEDGAYDEHGNLYKIPQAVISDPEDVVEDMSDIDSQTVTGGSDLDAIAAKLEATDGGGALEQNKQTSAEAKARAVKGKTAVRDAIKVRCRLSDRGSPECDVTVVLGRSEKVALLSDRIGVERDVSIHLTYVFFAFCPLNRLTLLPQIPSRARLRFAYLGKMLDATKTLEEQGWREGDVIQVLVVGNWK